MKFLSALSRKPKQTALPVAAPTPAITGELGRILRPQAAYRWLLPSLAAITPQYVEMTLRGALAGNHVQQWELFDLMLDTWPELAACAQELTDAVTGMQPVFSPFIEEGEKPTDTALEKSRLVSSALRSMRPKAAVDENDFDGTIRDLVDGWFRGVTALEVDWRVAQLGKHGPVVSPRATFWVHPVCYAWSAQGELGLRNDAQGRIPGAGSTSAQPMPSSVMPFPEHKFLVGIHKAKAGTALGGSLLRPLAWWWCAANFASDWVLNLAQVFGLPFRWANYDPNAPQDTINAICSMLQNMGSAGWAAFPAGTTLELKETGTGSDHSPQGELLDRADRYARLLILGQTMSGSHGTMGKGGGQAFGSVEEGVKEKRAASCAKYVAGVLNNQLIPSLLELNYGNSSEAPTVQFMNEKEGSLQEAQRDQVLAAAGLKIGANFLRQKYGIPAPDEDEETIGGGKADAPADPKDPMPPKPGEDPDEDLDEEPMKALAAKDSPTAKVAEALAIPPGWIAPIEQMLGELQDKIADKSVTDADLLDFFQATRDRLPELFGEMDPEELTEVFEGALGSAVIEGVRTKLREVKKP